MSLSNRRTALCITMPVKRQSIVCMSVYTRIFDYLQVGTMVIAIQNFIAIVDHFVFICFE